MTDFRSPLESREAFNAYRERVKQQLKTHVLERIAFLESAHLELQSLETLARRASNVPLVAELTNLAQQAEREVVALRGSDHAISTADESATLLPAGDGLRRPDNGASSFNAAVSTSCRPAVSRPTAPPSRPTPPVPPVPKNPGRPLEEIYRDVDALADQAEQDDPLYSDTPGLIRLKALLCRQRALQAELGAVGIQHWPLRQLLGHLRRRIDDEHGPGHYLIPLRAEIWPNESWPWYRLADLYDSLAEAYEALDWYNAEVERLNKAEREELLESIAAHQTRLWRHLQTYFPRQNDEHQISLFRDLCAIAEEEEVYLYSLQERCSDETLEERAEQLPVILEQLRLDRTQRTKREALLQELRQLVSDPDFGTRDSDPQALSGAVLRCRAEGIPASSTALRTSLMDWIALLEESEDKIVQEVVRELQREAERQAKKAETNPVDSDRPLSEHEQAELDTVRALVRGKRCLFIGGICREESRQRLERDLELAELVWPSTNGTESVYKFESDIQNTDITVILVRFMRTGWGQARELALRHGKMFVRLPAGYGLMQVVRQFYHQLLPHEAAVVVEK